MEISGAAWRRQLLKRLEKDLGRAMLDADLACIVWNEVVGTLTVQFAPLRAELKARNLISNVFRCHDFKN
jgi:hypothetical protein